MRFSKKSVNTYIEKRVIDISDEIGVLDQAKTRPTSPATAWGNSSSTMMTRHEKHVKVTKLAGRLSELRFIQGEFDLTRR